MIRTVSDSIEINLRADHLSLQQVLETVFRSTDFHFIIRNAYQVFISKGYTINTSLPRDFFVPEADNPDSIQHLRFNREGEAAEKFKPEFVIGKKDL